MKNLDILYKINHYFNNKNSKNITQSLDIKLNSIIIETDVDLIQYDISRNPVIYDKIENFASITQLDKLI